MKIWKNIWIDTHWAACSSLSVLFMLGGCSTTEHTSAADVAVTVASVDQANAAGADQFAPAEMQSARDKLLKAQLAMQRKEYELSSELAIQAQADATLAQSKAKTAQAQAVAKTLQDNIRVLRDELQRVNKSR
ncbi:DUF4398 domain-containing protein [Undibacterium crateris]|uniref:DUF4398 domain-containing protein n=1 Tax=Undibacterium crateris TaxID=2528175 RepID=UPI001389FBBF|nr:DUF4398 domain-containing protein [Undibacterium crateris]NDI84220.1 DUF4398 domain-containing protein [Undibacterium crateris]